MAAIVSFSLKNPTTVKDIAVSKDKRKLELSQRKIENILKEQASIDTQIVLSDAAIKSVEAQRADLIDLLNEDVPFRALIFGLEGVMPGLGLSEDASFDEIRAAFLTKVSELRNLKKEFENSPEGMKVKYLGQDRDLLMNYCQSTPSYRSYILNDSMLHLLERKYSFFLKPSALQSRKLELKMMELEARIQLLEEGMGSLMRMAFQQLLTHPELEVPDEALPSEVAELRSLYHQQIQITESLISPTSYHRVNGQWQMRSVEQLN